MASNVIGSPITDTTLKGMIEYHDKPITAVDRARVAMEMKNAEGKDTGVRKFVDSESEYVERTGMKKCARCLIYNATGAPIRLVATYEYTSCVSMSPFPSILENGQWAGFLHENTSPESFVALVYEGTHASTARQWVVGWFQTIYAYNRCYGEIRGKGHYSMKSPSDVRDSLKGLIKGSDIAHTAQSEGRIIFSSMGNTGLPIYEAILTLEGAISEP